MFRKLPREAWLIIAILAFVLLIHIMRAREGLLAPSDFLSARNLSQLARQIALLGIFALGSGLVIIAGGIDLSTGSVICLTGVLAARTPEWSEFWFRRWIGSGSCPAWLAGRMAEWGLLTSEDPFSTGMLVWMSLVALLNAALGLVGDGLQRMVGFGAGLSLQLILGWVFAPIAWALGVTWQDSATIGNLLGTRMVLNEFVAYSQLGPLKATLDPKSFTIATFALCGFANFSSIGIQIGGIGALAPDRRHDLARLGLRAMLAGTFANFLTATIAGMLL